MAKTYSKYSKNSEKTEGCISKSYIEGFRAKTTLDKDKNNRVSSSKWQLSTDICLPSFINPHCNVTKGIKKGTNERFQFLNDKSKQKCSVRGWGRRSHSPKDVPEEATGEMPANLPGAPLEDSMHQVSSASTLLIFGASLFFVVRGCPAQCRMPRSTIHPSNPNNQNVSRLALVGHSIIQLLFHIIHSSNPYWTLPVWWTLF